MALTTTAEGPRCATRFCSTLRPAANRRRVLSTRFSTYLLTPCPARSWHHLVFSRKYSARQRVQKWTCRTRRENLLTSECYHGGTYYVYLLSRLWLGLHC